MTAGHGHAHGHGHTHSHAPIGLGMRAALASVSVALFLTALKAFAAISTGSVAMLGSLADSGLDLIASLVTLAAVRIAAQPADHAHRFGHGKAEALAALFQVALISASALLIGWRAIDRLTHQATTEAPELGIAVSLIAIAVTLILLAYQRYVVRKTGSLAIQSDHLHYQSDLLLNLSVIAALVLDTILHIRGADAVMGVGIALWLIWGAWNAARAAIDQLMDREWPEDRRARFLAVALTHPELAGIHDLRTRTSGNQDFVQFHVWVDPDMTVREAHRVMDEVEAQLAREFPDVEILIHPDPQGHADDESHFAEEIPHG